MTAKRKPRRERPEKPAEPSSPEEPSSSAAAFRATVSLNDILVGMVEQLAFARQFDHLPLRLRSAVDYLALEAAKLQGVTEWITKRLVVLAPDADLDDEHPPEEE